MERKGFVQMRSVCGSHRWSFPFSLLGTQWELGAEVSANDKTSRLMWVGGAGDELDKYLENVCPCDDLRKSVSRKECLKKSLIQTLRTRRDLDGPNHLFHHLQSLPKLTVWVLLCSRSDSVELPMLRLQLKPSRGAPSPAAVALNLE